MLRKYLPIFIASFLLLFSAADCDATKPPKPPMGPPPCWPPPCSVPLDGGISILIAAGAALGGKKFYDFRRKSS